MLKKIFRVFLISLIVLICIAFGITMFTVRNVQKSFEIEQENYIRMVEQISDLYSQKISLVAESYSLWNDFYAYMKNPNREFEENYLNMDYFRKYGIDFIAVYDLNSLSQHTFPQIL